MSDPSQYYIGLICSIFIEYSAARLILDEKHPPSDDIHRNDSNIYTLGRIGKHNVVIAVLSENDYGTTSAAVCSTNMLSSFPNVKIGLLVGVGGGVPTIADIRLGDIVVSVPKEDKSGVLQYNFGKTVQNQEFQITKHLDKPPRVLRNAATVLKAEIEDGLDLAQKIEEATSKHTSADFRRPEKDRLYKPNIVHEGANTCEECDRKKNSWVTRAKRTGLLVHYGLIASGDQVINDAVLRDTLARKYDVLCFETEAAGLMNHFPCLVIRGICYYSDSHKTKEWQGFAAIAAAVYTKELLALISPSQLQPLPAVREIDFSLPFALPNAPVAETFVDRLDSLSELESSLAAGDDRQTVVISGLGGIGKTQLAIEYARRHKKDYSAILWIDGKDSLSVENSFLQILQRLKTVHPSKFQRTTDINDTASAIDAVLAWLNMPGNSQWLMIFDNVDEPDIPGVVKGLYDIRKYFPSTLHGHIMVTTRSSSLQIGKQTRLKQRQDSEDCMQILQTASMQPETAMGE